MTKRTVTIASACMPRQGTPTFVLQDLQVTTEEYENGLHYALAEDWLTDAGYDEPFVHFADEEMPAFLLDALKQQVAQALSLPDPITEPPEGA
ncbi:MAG: hypothetical protein JNM56_02715 [Planctomycetia bacterium]|nr:hypothetical protein [Planctomycetia bacterium]